MEPLPAAMAAIGPTIWSYLEPHPLYCPFRPSGRGGRLNEHRQYAKNFRTGRHPWPISFSRLQSGGSVRLACRSATWGAVARLMAKTIHATPEESQLTTVRALDDPLRVGKGGPRGSDSWDFEFSCRHVRFSLGHLELWPSDRPALQVQHV